MHPDDTHEYHPDPHATVDYSHFTPNLHPKSKLRRAIPWAIAAVLLLAGGGAVYWFALRPAPAPRNPVRTSAQPAASAGIATGTKHYTSTTFGLSFDYPKDWSLTEQAGSGKLTAVSPAVRLKAASGSTVQGHVVLTIRDKNQPLTEFDKGNAVAARESQKINYAKPSSSQRASTYLSFLQYASTAAAGTGLDGVYVTGDYGYQAGQAVPKADFVPVDPVISITFAACQNSQCSGQPGAALTVAASVWDNQQIAKPLADMLMSLVVN